MGPLFIFFSGLLLLGLFAWYFVTESDPRKRWIGLILTLLLVGFCLESTMPPSVKIRLGLDLRGGTSFLLRLIPQPGSTITPDMLEQAVEVIRKRVDQFGVGEPVIAPQGSERILVQIPGLDPAQIQATRETLKRVAKLEFSQVYPGGEELIKQIEKGEAIMPPGYEIKTYILPARAKEAPSLAAPRLIVKKRADLTGDHVTKAFSFFDQGGYGVSLSFDGVGAATFFEVTSSLAPAHGRLAILLDGKIQSAPEVKNAIAGGQAQITGRFQDKEARDLASALENPLRTPVEIEETRSVSPSLGADSIRAGVVSGMAGLALVMIFVLFYYHLAGVVALLGLCVNVILLFGMMSLFHFVLTLPGIAGIILTIGLAVDSNVLLYERLREEMATGKSLVAAVQGAYSKAFSAIFDANVTTLITAGMLFWQASGPVRGFSITLVLGVVASMFSAILFTRTLFRWMIKKGGLKKLTMSNLAPKKQWNFLRYRYFAVLISLILILGSFFVFAKRGASNFGIDFRGGDLLVVNAEPTLTITEARKALLSLGLSEITIQREQASNAFMLAIRSPENTSNKILASLKKSFPQHRITAVQEDKVGAQIGREFARKAFMALALGMMGILLYVSLRFGLSFAIGALVALLHDVIITVGLFSLLGGELSLVMVGAILTIAGYSINDTIVVYDRIREGLQQKEGRGSVQNLMNRSINETLGRTMLTGGMTLLSVSALFFFGGAVLKDFAFAILLGILVGTYSSVFVASPIVLWWSHWSGKSLHHSLR